MLYTVYLSVGNVIKYLIYKNKLNYSTQYTPRIRYGFGVLP